MDPETNARDVAARIADGSAVDWVAAASAADGPEGRALLDALRTIADVAALHRAPPDACADPAGPLPETWGPLTIMARVGAGRFGDVYLAWDARLQRRVALKVHRGSISLASPQAAIEEARLLARVKHPNVLTVYGAEAIDGQAGIWTEFIEGRTLDAVVAGRGPLPPDEVIDIGVHLASALQAVHHAGLLHRDIKPQNVMQETGGRIVLMDFGTGHDLALAPTRSGDLSGTPLYLAPEVLAGGAPSRASDIYALGVLLFYLLTGTHPAAGKTLSDVKAAHEHARLSHLLDLRPDVPPALAAIIDKASATDPRQRYQSASSLHAALIQAGRITDADDAHGALDGRRLRGWTSQRRAFSLIASAVTALTISAIWIAASVPPAEIQDHSDVVPLPSGTVPDAGLERLGFGPQLADVGRPSRDGRVLPYIDTKGTVWLRTVGSDDADRALALDPDTGAPSDVVMSPDAAQFVYTAQTGGDRFELRIASTTGGPARRLMPAELGRPTALEWSRDGKRILCTLRQSDGKTGLVLVYLPDGLQEYIPVLGDRSPRSASLSPGGDFVVYDAPRDPLSGRRQLVIAGVPAVNPVPARILLAGEATDMMPLWTPDGAGVFFISDRSGSMDGYVVGVVNGQAVGEPTRVARHLDKVWLATLTDDGRLFLARQTNNQDVFKVAIGPDGVVPGSRQRVSPARRRGHTSPGWSPDGRFLSYITAAGRTVQDPDSDLLTILDQHTGRERTFPLAVRHLGVMSPRWSPDGKRLLIRARGLDGRLGFYHVDLRTGDVAPIVTWPDSDGAALGAFAWAPDSNGILYLRWPLGIVSKGLSVGAPEIVVVPATGRRRGWSLLVSPDGKRIAYTTFPDTPGSMTIETANIDGSGRDEVITIEAQIVLQGWTRDDRLLYTVGAGAVPNALYSVHARGGDPVDMRLAIDGNTQMNKLALSPDDKWLAFSEGFRASEFWVLSGFLPAARAAQR